MAIDELQLVWECYDERQFVNNVIYLPL